MSNTTKHERDILRANAEQWTGRTLYSDVAHDLVIRLCDDAERPGLYMIQPHPESGYPACGVCGEDAHWDLMGRWCSKHFIEEAERQAKEQQKAFERAIRWRMDR